MTSHWFAAFLTLATLNYQLRLATETDYQFCYDLTKQNMLTLFSRHWGGWIDSAFREGFHAEETTIIRVDGCDVGYFSLKDTAEYLHLSNIQLSPAVQRQGIGSSVIKEVLRDATKEVRLTTFSDNPAMRLYKRLGFEVRSCDGETVHMVKQ